MRLHRFRIGGGGRRDDRIADRLAGLGARWAVVKSLRDIIQALRDVRFPGGTGRAADRC